MSLLSLIAVLLIEQVRPLSYRVFVFDPLCRLAVFLEARFNAGKPAHSVLAWCVGPGGLVLLAGGVYFLLNAVSPLLAWLWSVLVLYLTMGFRQFSHYYTDIQFALRMGDEARACALLAEWSGRPFESSGLVQIARRSIEQALVDVHRQVFGALLYFVLLPGPCGAVLYRVAAVFAETWGRQAAASGEHTFAVFADKAFYLLDWLPARVTAISFAVVGNFEDAVYRWRARAKKWADDGLGIVLASGEGALGVRLGEPAESGEVAVAGEAEYGAEPGVDSMQSAAGLIWRALLFWLLLLLLLSLIG